MSSLNDVVTTPTDTNSAANGLIGRVKWFNNKAGYGFITITDGDKSGTDIFVHHSSIGVSSEQYKYLVQGEYVEFTLNKVEGGTHDYQAVGVCGIKNGKLMCETRRDLKLSRTNYKSSNDITSEKLNDVLESVPRSTVPRLRGSGPREETSNSWSLVKKEKSSKKDNLETTKVSRPRGRPPRSVV
jgi:cold shock CspA family protein